MKIAIAILSIALATGWAQAQNVVTQHFNNQRTGAYLHEKTLTPACVKSDNFGLLFTRKVMGSIYAQPLYVADVSIPNRGTHNVVYVVTMHNQVYAFDADDPNASEPLWTVGPETIGPAAGLNNPLIGYPNYKDIFVEVGIMSTPAISVQEKALYFVAFADVNDRFQYRLHKLNMTTGEPMAQPVEITAPGSTFTPHQQDQRPGLLLDNDIVYVAFGAFGDHAPWNGWVFSYDAASLKMLGQFNTTPGGNRGGVWMSGQGIAADENHNIYFTTGNGSFQSGAQLSESFIKLYQNAEKLELTSWFTACNQACLSQQDLDLSSGGVLLIPDTTLLVGGGKEGRLYVIDYSQDLGGYDPTVNKIKQSFCAGGTFSCVNDCPHCGCSGSGGAIRGTPVFWNDSLYVWPESGCPEVNNTAYQFKLNKDKQGFDNHPASTGTVPCLPYPGGILSISADGNTPGTGVLWAYTATQNANQQNSPWVLYAFDASDLSKPPLWHSGTNPGNPDEMGFMAKFAPPMIAKGKVYLATIGPLGFQPQPTSQPNPAHLIVYGAKESPCAP